MDKVKEMRKKDKISRKREGKGGRRMRNRGKVEGRKGGGKTPWK